DLMDLASRLGDARLRARLRIRDEQNTIHEIGEDQADLVDGVLRSARTKLSATGKIGGASMITKSDRQHSWSTSPIRSDCRSSTGSSMAATGPLGRMWRSGRSVSTIASSSGSVPSRT